MSDLIGDKAPNRAGWLAKLAVSLTVLSVLLYRAEVGRIVAALHDIRPGLLSMALGLYVCGQLLSAAKWSLVGGELGFRRFYGEYATFYFIGMFVNLLGPSTLGGDVTRALYLGGSGHRALALNSVLFDRASGLVVLVAIGLVALGLFPQYGLPASLTGLAAALALFLLLSWWMVPRLVGLILPVDHRIRRLIEEDLAPFWRDRRFLARVAVLSAAFHLVEVSVQYVLARTLGLDVPFSYCLILHPAVSVLAAIPVSVAGLGIREGGYVFFLDLVGVSTADAFSFGLLWFAIAVAGALPGAVLLLRRGLPGRQS
jgi:uncharacterized membrane protein YbhN (UPF0104 family)